MEKLKINGFNNTQNVTSENAIKEIDNIYSFGEIVTISVKIVGTIVYKHITFFFTNKC